MACSNCGNIVMTIHCKAPECKWQRCVRCRSFGIVGEAYSPYLPAATLEQLYALDPITVEARSPQAPSVGSNDN